MRRERRTRWVMAVVRAEGAVSSRCHPAESGMRGSHKLQPTYVSTSSGCYPTLPYPTLPHPFLPYPTLPYRRQEGEGGGGGCGKETGTWRGRGPKGRSPALAIRWATRARWVRRGRSAAPDQPSPPPQLPSQPPNCQARGRYSAGAGRRTIIHVFSLNSLWLENDGNVFA